MKVSLGVGLGGSPPRCIECGKPVVASGLVVGLYVDHPQSPDAMQRLGEFCEECAGRFSEIDQDDANPLAAKMRVDESELRAAILKSAKRLRVLARDLEDAEVVRD